MSNPTIWIFSLEPLETRYTAEWHKHVPELLKKKIGDQFNIIQIDGIQKNSQLTPGAFLNFSDTNYWKSSQLCAFLERHNAGETSTNDQFLFTDAWNPTVIQLKYMKSLLGFNWKLHGLWHAGSYDPEDFLGRLVGNKPWVRHAEKSFYDSYDHNYFATDFHVKLLFDNLLNNGYPSENPWYYEDWEDRYESGKIVQTGWPMEYMEELLIPYKNEPKSDLILFPHRLAPEKQLEIFKDLSKQLPQYEFIVCQEEKLTKHEYHKLLGRSKMVFSANLQETLGISCYEGAIVGSIPFIPDRLSYSEMYYEVFKYPSEWTDSWANYNAYKKDLCHDIIKHMTEYETRLPTLEKQVIDLTNHFFSANNLIERLTLPK